MVVDFEQGVGFLGNLHQSLEVKLCRSITRVGDNLNVWIAHGVDNTLRILFLAASLPAEAVNAGDADVHQSPIVLVQIDVTLGIEDV